MVAASTTLSSARHHSELEPGIRAQAQWTLHGDEWFFPDTFPGGPPRRSVALRVHRPCGAVVILSEPKYTGRLPLFGGVEHARFRRQVLPGDTVTLECEITRLSARGGKGHGRATVGGQLSVESDLLFILADEA